MKKLLFVIQLYIWGSLCHAQIGVNNETYKDGTLVIEPTSRATPSPTSGVIIPRVQTLNTVNPKEDGLLVYLNNPTPPLVTGEYNGFHYWDIPLNRWVPLQSRYAASSIDQSQFFVSGTSFATGTGRMNDTDNPATIALGSLITNNPALCTLSSNTITVNKTGWYYFQISVTLTKNANPGTLRDILALQLFKNGTHAYLIPGQVIIRSFNAYAADNPASNTFTTYTPLQLTAGDQLQLSVERIYTDPSGGEYPFEPVTRVNAEYSVTSGTVATLTGKYLGNF